MSFEAALAQLRHAYAQLAAESVKAQKQFADGLIAPAIRALEAAQHSDEPVQPLSFAEAPARATEAST